MTSPRSNSVSDHNILFGMLALQMDLVSRDELIAALQNWMLDKSRRLDELLVEAGVIDEQSQQVLLPLVDLHIRQHEGDARQSIAAVPVASDVIQELKESDDSDVQASLAHVSTGALDQDTGASLAGYSQETLIVRKRGKPQFDGDRFELVERHAEGGIGRVSIARDLALNREVAFKELKPGFASDRSARQRFVLEAEITGRLEHPGIVPVYASGRLDDERPFYAMKFVRGTSLRDAIRDFHESYDELPDRDQTLRFRDLLMRFVSVCHTLDYTHARGVVHRDIKPANIMLGEFGETLVVDWGLAKAIGRAETHAPSPAESTLHPEAEADVLATQDGSVIGTLYYMSPEQAAGNIGEVDWLSDVYSLGATLYELLTGIPSIVAGQPREEWSRTPMDEILRRVREGDFPRPRDVLPRVPGALNAICMRAMQVHKRDRYQSAGELAVDVESWLADEPISAWVEPLAQQAERFTSQVTRGQVDLMLSLANAAEVTYRNGDQAKAQYFYGCARQIVDSMHQAITPITIRDRVRVSLRLADVTLRLREAGHALRYCETALESISAIRATDEVDSDLAISEVECIVKLAAAHSLFGESAKHRLGMQRAFGLIEGLADQHPHNLRVQRRLIEMCYQKAEGLCREGLHSEARPFYQRACDVLHQLIEAGIDTRNSERSLQAIEPAIQKCIAMQPLPLLLAEPADDIPKLLSQRNHEQLYLGQVNAAVESAEVLGRLTPQTASNLYYSTRCLCRCIAKLTSDREAVGTPLSESDLIEQALECLEKAKQHGFEFSDGVVSDSLFRVLHDEERFWSIVGAMRPEESAFNDESQAQAPLERSGITVIVSDLVSAPTITLAYNPQQSMRSLIDDVYWLLQGSVPKYSYAETWALRNDDSGDEYRDIDAYTNKLAPANYQPDGKGGRRYVRFTVERAGILPGATLRVVRLDAE
jgi:serine/threonine protein kinase